MECTLRSWLRVPSPILIDARDMEKCCASSQLLSASNNFDKELMMDHELDQSPNYLRLLISSCCGFSQKSSTYNNLVAMAATVVCNYNNTNGYTRHGNGP
jgi:hypothetical protein